MPETEVDILVNTCPTLSAQQVPLPPPPQPCSAHQSLTLPQPSSVQPRAEMESPCMEIEAAHRKLQEIEDRCGTTFCLLVLKLSQKYKTTNACAFMHNPLSDLQTKVQTLGDFTLTFTTTMVIYIFPIESCSSLHLFQTEGLCFTNQLW